MGDAYLSPLAHFAPLSHTSRIYIVYSIFISAIAKIQPVIIFIYSLNLEINTNYCTTIFTCFS